MKNIIEIKKAILHICEEGIEAPILSDVLIDLNSDVITYLKKHIEKALKSNLLKRGRFRSEVNGFKDLLLEINDNNFIEKTQYIAKILHNFYLENDVIPKGDLIFIEFSDNDRIFFSMLKFNFVDSFNHIVECNNEIWKTQIVRNKRTLPDRTKLVDESFFINMNTLEFNLIEKRYVIDGKQICYLSNYLLKEEVDKNVKNKQKALEKTFSKIVLENKNPIESMQLKESIINDVMTSENNIEEALNNTNMNSKEKEYLRDEIQKHGITSNDIQKIYANRNKTRKQKIITDSGIEITIPIKLIEEKKGIEILNNDDGTISLTIKDVRITNS